MKRECKIVRRSEDGKRAIYVDTKNKAEILNYLFSDERHKKKFKFIEDIIFGGYRNTELYDKENINDYCKFVTAMKFFKGQENDRIYCQDTKSKSGISIVVMSIFHSYTV